MHLKIISEYDQEKTQSQTAENPLASQGRAPQQSRDTQEDNKKQSNQLCFPHRDDCKTRIDTR